MIEEPISQQRIHEIIEAATQTSIQDMEALAEKQARIAALEFELASLRAVAEKARVFCGMEHRGGAWSDYHQAIAELRAALNR